MGKEGDLPTRCLGIFTRMNMEKDGDHCTGFDDPSKPKPRFPKMTDRRYPHCALDMLLSIFPATHLLGVPAPMRDEFAMTAVTITTNSVA